ncbi:MAG: aminoacyl-histidine dipeptidase [Ruminococcaceae bacterium]|nr:aminoacyl-histidine dipeptidase [Oscillospiraceae bacterium]
MININNDSAQRVFDFFEEISGIPHTSGNTSGIADYLVSFAKARGLEYTRDEYDNVIIRKNATRGYENRETIIIQGHSDMVWAVENGREIDMNKVGVKILKEGDFLTADGTTLGADNGIFVSCALAILEADDIEHPDLEMLFTSNEEIGLLGAMVLDASLLKGRKMINLDSDIEGIFTAGCAGGVNVDVTLPYEKAAIEDGLYTVTVSGLLGGHSGSEINKGRENAIKILAEVIRGSELAMINGGNADNAIPRSATATIKPDALENLNDRIASALSVYTEKEKEIDITVLEHLKKEWVFSKEDTEKITDFIKRIPTGVHKMSEEFETLPQTSSNLGIISTKEGRVSLSALIRSSKNEEKFGVCDRIKHLSDNVGAQMRVHSEYPAWEYKKNSPLRDAMVAAYEKHYATSPKVTVIHEGLECGIFSDKIEGLDCISIGPDMFDLHTTEERVSISSTIRVFEYLKAALKEI